MKKITGKAVLGQTRTHCTEKRDEGRLHDRGFELEGGVEHVVCTGEEWEDVLLFATSNGGPVGKSVTTGPATSAMITDNTTEKTGDCVRGKVKFIDLGLC